jgi:hypothetical protein
MVDLIIILHIHICREEASFQLRENVWSGGSARKDKKLRIYVGADQCEIIGRRRYNGSEACDPDGQSMKVHKCDGHGKVDHALVKSMFRRDVSTLTKDSRIGNVRHQRELPFGDPLHARFANSCVPLSYPNLARASRDRESFSPHPYASICFF